MEPATDNTSNPSPVPESPKAMDIVPPKPQPIKVTDANETTTEMVLPAENVAENPVEQPVEAPQSAPADQNAVRPTPPEVLAQDVFKDPSTLSPNVMPASMPKKAKSKVPIAAIILAILIAIVLAGAGMMAFKKPAKKATTVTPTPVSQQTPPKVTTADLTATTDAIDQSVKQINDTTDFGSNDLADTSLGL